MRILAAPLLACLLLGACMQPGTRGDVSLEQRLDNMERRIESLERRESITPAPPLRSREEIEQQISALERQRESLLTQYTEAHPAIRDIDRRVRILREQLDMLK
jgi:septal ring factor EnvC (AmiA/AmiB activator)